MERLGEEKEGEEKAEREGGRQGGRERERVRGCQFINRTCGVVLHTNT